MWSPDLAPLLPIIFMNVVPTPESELHVSVVDVEVGQVGHQWSCLRRSDATAELRPCRFENWPNDTRSTGGRVRQALASALPPPRKEYVARPRPAIDPWATVIRRLTDRGPGRAPQAAGIPPGGCGNDWWPSTAPSCRR